MFILVTGGARSGRSNYALRRGAELGPPPWLYVTGREETEEVVRKRVDRYRRDKEAIWRTAPMPRVLPPLIGQAEHDGIGALVVDGFVDWLAKRLNSLPVGNEGALLTEVEELSEKLVRSPVPILVVTQELGQGIPPPDGSPEQRLLRLVAGANQLLAPQANALALMVAGVPLRVR
jgi:adenosylcobinamide kinase/adenosylcobinamide-phosphate guanylyltransferase